MWIDDEEWNMKSRLCLGYRGMSLSTFRIPDSTKGPATNVELEKSNITQQHFAVFLDMIRWIEEILHRQKDG